MPKIQLAELPVQMLEIAQDLTLPIIGQRKIGARALAETGTSDAQIMALLGKIDDVGILTERANQARLIEEAVRIGVGVKFVSLK